MRVKVSCQERGGMWCLQLFRTTGVLDENKVGFWGGDGQSKQVSEMKSMSLFLDASDT